MKRALGSLVVCAIAVSTATSHAPATVLVGLGEDFAYSLSYPTPGAPNWVTSGQPYRALACDQQGNAFIAYGVNVEKYLAPTGAAGGVVIQELSPFYFFNGLSITQDNSFVASGRTVGVGYEIRRYDPTGAFEAVLQSCPDGQLYTDVCVSPDGRGFVTRQELGTFARDCWIDIFDVETGASLGTITQPPSARGRDIEYGPDGRLYFSTDGARIYAVDAVPGANAELLVDADRQGGSLAIGPDGVLYLGSQRTIDRYSLTGEYLGVFADVTSFMGRTQQTSRLAFGNVIPAPGAGLPLLAGVLAMRRRR